MSTRDTLLRLLQRFEGLAPSTPVAFSQEEIDLLGHVVWVAFCMEREKEMAARVAEVFSSEKHK